jgi:ketosteroid isomerase-like protein
MSTISRAFLPFIVAGLAHGAVAGAEDAARTVAALDTQYQTAVERNDWQTMDRILHPDFVLVLGDGAQNGREDLLQLARDKTYVYEKQVEVPGTQTVRLFGNDTATVTALLWMKGRSSGDGKTFDYKLWFTDTYVRTSKGWKYAFGQASLPLPAK